MVAWAHVGVAGALGGFFALERRAFLQAMVSRPLVCATVIGLAMGDTASGLFVGLLLELFYLGSASLGAALPDNETLAACGAAAAAAALAHGTGAGGTPAIWSAAILLFIGLGPAGRILDRALERYSARLASKAMRSAELGQLRRAMRQNLWGMWPHFLCSALVTAGCAAAGGWAVPWLDRMPLGLVRGLAWAYPAMASVAGAIAARGSHSRRAAVLACGAAVLVCLAVTAYQLQRRPW
jgi:mannose/fructose/N-acetylgalactosamine-specific phosphotransferase system component IIC